MNRIYDVVAIQMTTDRRLSGLGGIRCSSERGDSHS
jgi:hypothetical protein